MSKNRTGITNQVRASIKTESYNKSDNTIDVVFVTESPVVMEEDGQRFVEILSCDPTHIRLERLQAGAPFLKVHNPDELENQIGVVIDVWFENNEGWARIRLSKRPDCAGIVGDIVDGILKNISVGYDVLEYESLGTNDKGYPILKAIDWEPAEISATPIPADYMATTRSKYIKQIIQNSKKRTMKKTREEKIRSLAKRYGVDETVAEQMITDGVTVEDALEKIMEIINETPEGDGADEGDVPAEEGGEGARSEGAGDDAGDDEGGEGERAAEGAGQGQRAKVPVKSAKPLSVVQERQRASTIFKAVRTAGLDNSLALELIEKGTSQARAMETIVNKMAAKQTPTNARMSGRDEQTTARTAMVQALLVRARPSEFKPTLEKAKEYRGYSMLDMARELLEQTGVNTRGLTKNELASRALSTSDFPSLMSNISNKFLRKAYEEAPQTWRPLATQMSASDFKDITGIQAGGSIQLEEVQENGEYKYADMAESAEKFRVKTYGKIIRLSRQMLINDDLNAFSRTSRLIGNAGARLESDIMWALLLSNPKMADGKTLFHADHKNLAASGAALSIDSLSAARVAISRQTGLDKEQLNLLAKYLIVSPEKLTLAEQLMTGITSTETGNVNPFTGKYNIISDARITDANPWYMIADPGMIDTLGYAYLEGHEGVYVEQRETFNTDGVEIKARHDFGGVVWDHRGLYKNPGA